MSAGEEFRVSWRREGLRRVRRLYQTRKGADEWAALLRRLDEAPVDEHHPTFGGQPPPSIVEGPTVEQRPVGEWGPA